MRGIRANSPAGSATATALKISFIALGVAFGFAFGISSAAAQLQTAFPLPRPGTVIGSIVKGPDNNFWFTETFDNKIGRMTPAGVVTEFNVPTPNSQPRSIVAGPDGNLWFTGGGKVSSITTAGVITEYTTPFNTALNGITVGPDLALWFGVNTTAIGRITTTGTVTQFPLPVLTNAVDITTGQDGALWFTVQSGGNAAIGRMTTTGVYTQVHSLSGVGIFNQVGAQSITQGPDGALWFVETDTGLIGRITTSGVLTEFHPPAGPATGLRSIAPGPDGAMWFTEAGPKIGRITTAGAINEFRLPADPAVGPLTKGADGNLWVAETNQIVRVSPNIAAPTALVSAVLPSSRSVQVNKPASAFATIINTGTNIGTDCDLSLDGTIPATFSYQTTDSATNQRTGTADTPAQIPVGGTQSFVFAVTPSAPLSPSNVSIVAKCANNSVAPTTVGLNTLLLSASTSPAPDVVALGATSPNNGILSIPGVNKSAAFSVASVNVGASATLTVSLDTGLVALPVKLSICQTNPSTAACLAPPAASVTSTIATNDTPTFSVFATATGTIAFDAAKNRVFVRFRDFNGDTRGSTSVAVRTQ